MRIKEIRTLPETSRGAFTLMELLVVIAIIAALAALSAAATLKFIGSQQESNTKSTLNKTKSQVDKAWSKVKDQAYQETIPPAYLPGIQALAGSDANATGRVRVIYVKLKLRQAFPMNFNEALNPAPLPPLPAYTTYLNSVGVTGSTGAPYESSACLLMALQRGVSGAGIDPSELTAGGATGSIGSLTYLNDAWGRPIFFTRVPTGCPVLNPNGPQPGANDPGDPLGYLNSGSWPQNCRTTFSAITLQQLAPPPTPPSNIALSYKLAPMVASGGPENWAKTNLLTFHPITFQPGIYNLSTGAFTPSSGTPVLFNNP